jgi:hypothetical protein
MSWPVTIQQLDAIFPYVCFFYGAIVSLALSSSALGRIADERLPAAMVARWRAHRGLAFTCLFVGAAWILQNLWLA